MVNPLGIVAVPGELAAALRTLPEVLDALRRVGADTRRMADNTAELPDVRAQLEQVAANASVLPGMDERMATIEGLNAGIAQLISLMDGLQSSLGHLHESLEPLGRLADRIPGGNRR